jgi:hypothetical protein
MLRFFCDSVTPVRYTGAIRQKGNNPLSRKRYKSYLLRLWQAGSGGEQQWRASLEDARGGERIGFATLNDLCAFLRRQTGTPPEPDEKGKDRRL